MPSPVTAEVKLTVVPAHIVVGLPLMLIVGTMAGVTVIVTVLEATVAGLAQPSLDVSVQLTTSPLARVLLEYVEVVTPTAAPLTNQI